MVDHHYSNTSPSICAARINPETFNRMKRDRCLLIATMLMPWGDTGVQMHFNLIAEYARGRGVPVRICTPFDVHINIRRIPGIATRILKLLSIEYATLWYRRWSYV